LKQLPSVLLGTARDESGGYRVVTGAVQAGNRRLPATVAVPPVLDGQFAAFCFLLAMVVR